MKLPNEGAKLMFNIGSEYTRDEIHNLLGGSKQSYLPTLSGRVVVACLKPNMNPRAPNVILCGKGKIIASAGAALATQQAPIPVFIKLGINRWEYKGEYKVTASYSSGSQFTALISGSKRKRQT
jgi:hypothetical protein